MASKTLSTSKLPSFFSCSSLLYQRNYGGQGWRLQPRGGGPWVALGPGSNSQTMQLHVSAATARNPQKKKDGRGVGRLFQQEKGQKDLRGKLGVHS